LKEQNKMINRFTSCEFSAAKVLDEGVEICATHVGVPGDDNEGIQSLNILAAGRGS
jgi:hypothetical protein